MFMSGIKVRIAKSAVDTQMDLPLAENGIVAGFPSPADDFFEVSIDLNKELIKHPSATFYGRVEGDSMRDEGIEDGDLLVIDRSLEPSDGKIAVCFIDGEFTVKKIKIEKDAVWLMPANPDYKPVKVTAENEFIIWGIVTYVIKKK
jgi:DNA polymerase V